MISLLLLFSLCATVSGQESGDRSLPLPGDGSASPARVLVIHSYGTDFQWTRDMDAGIREILHADPFDYAAVFSEYLDSKYHTTPSYFAAQAELMAAKYDGWTFDVLVVTDNRALEFVRRYRDRIFGEVPTVFAGINDYTPELTEGLTQVTGVPEEVQMDRTLNMAFALFPEGRLFVLGDGTLTYQRNRAILDRTIAAMDDPPETRVYDAITIRGLERVAAQVRPGDVVFLASSVLEDDGSVADFWRAGAIVSRAMPVPVFVMWDFFIGSGVAGGYLASGRAQGIAAAHMVRRILSGVPVQDIPVSSESPNRWIFDMRPLVAAGVPRGGLPAGSIILNQRESMWDEYRAEIMVVIVVLVAMGLLISLLFVNVRRRAVVAARLRESLSEKEILLKEIHHRVKNNLQVISSILNIQSSFIDDRQSLDYFKDCETRVQSMALVHEQLYQGTSLARIDLGPYLEELMTSLYSAMTASADGIRVSREVRDISLHLDQAIPVGLVVNELVSNAIKYAYPDGRGEIRLAVDAIDGTTRIRVRDWGVGLGSSIDRTESLGLQLVDALAAQLHGSVTFASGDPGLDVEFSFPRGEDE